MVTKVKLGLLGAVMSVAIGATAIVLTQGESLHKGMPGLASGSQNLDGSYTLTLSSDDRLSEAKTIKTALNNVIEFSHGDLTAYGSGWETFAPNGYCSNVTPISGLLSINVSFSGEGSLVVDYGFEGGVYEVNDISLTSGEDFIFYGEHPSYFRIRNASNSDVVNIAQLDINYACVPAVLNPYSSANLAKMSFSLIDENTAYSVGCANNNIEGDLVIPAFYNDLPVREIGENGFYYCSKLTSMTLPETMTICRPNAFIYCLKLATINLPASLTSIDESDFDLCPALASINVAKGGAWYFSIDGILYNQDLYKTKSVARCPRAKSGAIVLPSGLSLWGLSSSSFYQCTEITSVTIPDSVAYMGTWVFGDCESLESISLSGTSISMLRESAFKRCANLESIGLPASLTSIKEDVFNGCSSLVSVSYMGSEASWTDLTTNHMSSGNDRLTSDAVTVTCYGS